MRLALAVLLVGGCSGGSDGQPPQLRVLSPLLLTFEEQRSGVIVEVDRRARFAVVDEDGRPLGAAVAEQAGEFEVPFTPNGLAGGGSTLEVVAVSDDGGRSTRTLQARHGALGLVVLEIPLLAGAVLTDGRLVLLSEDGPLVQEAPGADAFGEPLDVVGARRTGVAAGDDGDFFAIGEDDRVLHYDAEGALCESVVLPSTQVAGGDEQPATTTDVATQFGAGPIEVLVAHDLGFSGFGFSGLDCALDDCSDREECPVAVGTSFSTGACISTQADDDTFFGATAIAVDGDRIYSGGYTLNVRPLGAPSNACIDLGTGADDRIADLAVSAESVWVAVAGGITRLARDFPIQGEGGAPPVPDVERYGSGRPVADGLEILPEISVRHLAPLAPGDDERDGVWFGTRSGFGRLLRSGQGAELAWVSGLSLPGREIRAILVTAEEPDVLWVATDGGLVQLRLPPG